MATTQNEIILKVTAELHSTQNMADLPEPLDTKRYDASRITGCCEPLVSEYELKRWANRTYFGSGDPRKYSTVMAPKQKLWGLVRR